MRNCDIKFVNKEITPFGGLSLFFKMLEKCHFEEYVMQSGVPLQGSNRGYKPRVSRNLVGINFRHPNVMPNFAVWKTITYRHWHRWCCQPRF